MVASVFLWKDMVIAPRHAAAQTPSVSTPASRTMIHALPSTTDHPALPAQPEVKPEAEQAAPSATQKAIAARAPEPQVVLEPLPAPDARELAREELSRGRMLATASRFHEAIAHLRRAVELDSQSPDAVYSLALALIGAGRREEARAQCALLKELDPRRANLLEMVLRN